MTWTRREERACDCLVLGLSVICSGPRAQAAKGELSCFFLSFFVVSWFEVSCSSLPPMLNCCIDPPRFHRMASISRGLCSTNDTRFTTIPARPVHAGSSFVRADSISLGWSQASCNRRPILAHPQYRVRSIRSHQCPSATTFEPEPTP